MNAVTKFPWVKLSQLVIVLVVLSYVVLRTANLSFTHDESFSFLYFADNPLRNILVFASHSNNHLLNTAGMFVMGKVFGSAEWALRFPNLLGLVIYIMAAVAILRPLSKWYWKILGLLLLLVNPFLLDFFGLARGYGLGIGLMMMSAYLAYQIIWRLKGRDFRYFVGFIVVGGAAVVTNITFLYVYILLQMWVFVKVLTDNRQKFLNRYSKLLVAGVITTLGIIAVPTIAMKIRGQLYFGGTQGIWEDTVLSLIRTSVYNKEFTATYNLEVIIAGSLVVMVLTCIYLVWRHRYWQIIFWPSLLLGSLVVVTGLNLVLKLNFPIERTALYLYPLWIVAILYVAREIQLRLPRVIGWGLPVILSAGLVLYAQLVFPAYQFNYTLDWRYDADTKQVVSDIDDVMTLNQGEIKTLGVRWQYVPTMQFYIQKQALDLTVKSGDSDRSELDVVRDMYFIHNDDKQYLLDRHADIVEYKYYPVSNSILFINSKFK